MAVTAKYTAPLQVVEEREYRDRIASIANDEEISQAQVIRDLVRHGIEWRERERDERLGRI